MLDAIDDGSFDNLCFFLAFRDMFLNILILKCNHDISFEIIFNFFEIDLHCFLVFLLLISLVRKCDISYGLEGPKLDFSHCLTQHLIFLFLFGFVCVDEIFILLVYFFHFVLEIFYDVLDVCLGLTDTLCIVID